MKIFLFFVFFTLSVLADSEKKTVDIMISGEVSVQLNYVPPGEFLMGKKSFMADQDELPQHKVIISRGFYLGVTEVTQRQWAIVSGSCNFCRFTDEKLPVENVSYYDCLEFIKKINGLTGKRFRLPSEAEWEYACRAGTESDVWWNSDTEESEFTWNSLNSGLVSHIPCEKKPNPWGFYDLCGNVWEWVADSYSPDFYSRSPLKDPCNLENSDFKVMRGGSYYNDGCFHSSHLRSPVRAEVRFGTNGLRLALDME